MFHHTAKDSLTLPALARATPRVKVLAVITRDIIIHFYSREMYHGNKSKLIRKNLFFGWDKPPFLIFEHSLQILL